MFIPVRKDGRLYKQGKKDVHGDRSFSLEPLSFGWAPVHIRENLGSSGVRADSSATKGRASETQSDVRILIEKKVTPHNGDKIVLTDGRELLIIRVQERMNLVGKLHHWEVDCACA